MPKYRKKPEVIESVQYTQYGELVKGMCNSTSCYASGNTEPHVHTIHKGQIVNLEIGDYIIPERDGKHYYPCKPDIFEITYEPVDPTPVHPDTPKHGDRVLHGIFGIGTVVSGVYIPAPTVTVDFDKYARFHSSPITELEVITDDQQTKEA